jgi:hypothetical protein
LRARKSAQNETGEQATREVDCEFRNCWELIEMGSTPLNGVAWDKQIYRERPPKSLALAKFSQEDFQPIARVVFPESTFVLK